MELNELRQLWSHQAKDELAPLSEQGVARMVARKSDSVVTKLRRNAWWEVGFQASVILSLPFLIYYAANAFIRWYLIAFEVFSLAFCYYYYCTFRLLRRMEDVETDLRGHLQALISGLRGLLALYLRLTLWVAAIVSVVLTSYRAYKLSQKYGGEELLLHLGLLIIIVLFAGAILYVALAKFTKWYLQKLYGQHLDRLESYLKELQAN
jgi:hypothetical protein